MPLAICNRSSRECRSRCGFECTNECGFATSLRDGRNALPEPVPMCLRRPVSGPAGQIKRLLIGEFRFDIEDSFGRRMLGDMRVHKLLATPLNLYLPGLAESKNRGAIGFDGFFCGRPYRKRRGHSPILERNADRVHDSDAGIRLKSKAPNRRWFGQMGARCY
jgi:hypothetical protein